MGSPALLLWTVLFGSIGVGYFFYGKKQRAVVPLCCGIVLCFYPYFMPNVIAMVVVGAIVVALPYFVRL